MKVSIVTTVFNDLDGLKRTGKSVLEQSFPVEWIVVDADSGSLTRKYLNELSSEKHVVKWISEKDKGLYDGMNKGFKLSTGEIIIFLNADDTLAEKETIAKVVASKLEDNWNWAVGLAVRINSNLEPQSVWEYFRPTLGGLALGTRTFCHQATFYSRELLLKLGEYNVNNLAADHLLNVRAFRISKPKMLPLVTTFFMNGGVSANRPVGSAFKDLRAIRISENILLLDSRTMDYLLTKLTVFLVKAGGFSWRLMRAISHRFVQEDLRITPKLAEVRPDDLDNNANRS